MTAKTKIIVWGIGPSTTLKIVVITLGRKASIAPINNKIFRK